LRSLECIGKYFRIHEYYVQRINIVVVQSLNFFAVVEIEKYTLDDFPFRFKDFC